MPVMDAKTSLFQLPRKAIWATSNLDLLQSRIVVEKAFIQTTLLCFGECLGKTATNNSAGQLISLYCGVTWKGNHDTSWQTVPQGIHFEDAADPGASQAIGRLISIGFKGVNSGGGAEGYMALLDSTATQIDFQVEAMIGYYNSNDAFVGQSSGWSNTQTLQVQVVSNPTPTPILTSTPTPSVPEFSWLTILPLLLVIPIALAIVRKRLQRNVWH